MAPPRMAILKPEMAMMWMVLVWWKSSGKERGMPVSVPKGLPVRSAPRTARTRALRQPRELDVRSLQHSHPYGGQSHPGARRCERVRR